MNNASYKKAVFKTLSVKPAKDGLRKLVRKAPTLNLSHAIVGLKSEMGELMQGLEGYLLGKQLTPAMKHNAMEELGDAGYYLTVACRSLHITMPASTKRVALKGMTLTAALLKLDSLATDMLDQFKKTFYGRDLNMEAVAALVKEFIPLYFAVVYTLLGMTVAVVMDGNIAKLSARYPQGFFDNADQHARDKAKELAAMEKAMADDKKPGLHITKKPAVAATQSA